MTTNSELLVFVLNWRNGSLSDAEIELRLREWAEGKAQPDKASSTRTVDPSQVGADQLTFTEFLNKLVNAADPKLTDIVIRALRRDWQRSTSTRASVWTRCGQTLSDDTFGNGRYTYFEPPVVSGEGEIWKAIDENSGARITGDTLIANSVESKRLVALKRPRRDLLEDPEADGIEERLLREGVRASLLEHPNICPVYDVFHGTECQLPFYVMRFLGGDTFAETICNFHQKRMEKSPDKNDWAKLIRRLVEVCSGVAYAHEEKQLVHLDLKPTNIMIGDQGETQVIDWGMCSRLSDEGFAIPSAEVLVAPSEASNSPVCTRMLGEISGTPAYSAPEQMLGQRCGVATDVFQLGAILYEILAGRAPFQAATSELTIVKAALSAKEDLNDRILFPHLRKHQLHCLAAVVDKAMAPLPQDRYPSVQAFQADLEAWIADTPLSVKTESLVQRLQRKYRKNRNAFRATATALIAFMAIVSSVFVYRHIVYYREYTEYYNDVVFGPHGPKGVGKISPKDLRSVSIAYKLTRVGLYGPTKLLKVIDGSGEINPFNGLPSILSLNEDTNDWTDAASIVRFDYKDGVISKEVSMDIGGRELWTVDYRPRLYDEKSIVADFTCFHFTHSTTSSSLSFSKSQSSGENVNPISVKPKSESVRSKDNAARSPRADVSATASVVKRPPLVAARVGNPSTDRRSRTGISRVVLKWDDGKVFTSADFFDRDHTPQPSDMDVFGYRDAWKGQTLTRTFVDANGNPTPQKDGIAKFILTYDHDGFNTAIKFFDRNDVAAKNKDGALGATYLRLKDIHPSRQQDTFKNKILYEKLILGADASGSRPNTLATTENSYDEESGRLITSRSIDIHGAPCPDKDGHSRWIAKYDRERLSQIDLFAFDAQKAGYAKKRMYYNNQGQVECVEFLGEDDLLCKNTEGISGWNSTFESGNETLRAFFGQDEKACANIEGHKGWKANYNGSKLTCEEWLSFDPEKTKYAIQRVTYNDNDERSKVEFLARDGETRCLDLSGIAGWSSMFESSNETLREFFGQDEKACANNEGDKGWKANYNGSKLVQKEWFAFDPEKTKYAIQRDTYNDNVELSKVEFLAEDEETRRLNGDGIAGWNSTFEDGKETLQEFFGKDGKSCANNDGDKGWKANYNGSKLAQKEWLTFDPEKAKYAMRRETYNDNEELSKVEFLADDGKTRRLNADGIAGWNSTFDNGNETRRAFFGQDEKSCANNEGDKGWKATYNGSKLVRQEWFTFDPERTKYAIQRNTFNENREVARVEFLAEDGKTRRLNGDGIAGWNSTFEDGKETLQEFFGKDGKSCADNDGDKGWKANYNGSKLAQMEWLTFDPEKAKYAMRRETYNDNEELSKVEFLADDRKTRRLNGDGVAGWNSTFDNGNETRRAFFGQDEKSCANNEGDKGWKATYNESKLVRQEWFKFDSEKTKYAIQRNTFNENREVARVEFLAEDGKTRRLNAIGIAGWNSKFDNGNETQRAFFGQDEKSCANKEGHKGWKARYNGSKLVRQDWLAFEPQKTSYAIQRQIYNDNEELSKVEFFAKDEETRRLNGDGIAGWNSTFDNGNETRRAFFGQDEKLCANNEGDKGWKAEYSGTKLLQKEWFTFDPEKTKYAIQRNTFNENGELSKVEFLAEDGKTRRLNAIGIAGWNSTFESGNETRQEFFDTDDKTCANIGGLKGFKASYNGSKLVRQDLLAFDPQKTKYAIQRNTLNENGEVARVEFLAEDGKTLRVNANGIAGWNSTFESGNETRQEFFDTDDKTCANIGGLKGFKASYNGSKLVRQDWLAFDPQKSMCAIHRLNYNDIGEVARVEFLAEDGKTLRVNANGIAGWNSTFESGNETLQEFFDTDNKTCANIEGHKGWMATYNGSKLVRQDWLAFDPQKSKCAIYRLNYNDIGKVVRVEFLAEDGNTRCLNTDGIAGWNSKFDETGNETSRQYFGVDGKPL